MTHDRNAVPGASRKYVLSRRRFARAEPGRVRAITHTRTPIASEVRQGSSVAVMNGFDGINIHLKHRDLAMISVSRAPYEKLAASKKRMGWAFKWVSSGRTDFNFDLHVSFTPEEMKAGKACFNYATQNPMRPEREGHSVFYRDGNGDVFHTCSCYARRNEMFNIHYHYLDVVPKGRDDNGRGSFWVRCHHEYEAVTQEGGALVAIRESNKRK